MSNFPDSPKGWTPSSAKEIAESQQLTLMPDHWNIVEVLQGDFKTHDKIKQRLIVVS
jgi:sulfur relay (sulfurtransferase) DsrC/TusE family protein